MRKIGNTNDPSAIASLVNQDHLSPFDPTSDATDLPAELHLANPGTTTDDVVNLSSDLSDILSAINSVDTSTERDQSHHVSIADGLPTNVGPLSDAGTHDGGAVTTLLASLDGGSSGGGASNHGSLGGSEAANDNGIDVPAQNIDVPVQNSVAPFVHNSASNSAEAPDATLIATNAASNQHSSLNLSDLGSGAAASQAPIFISSPVVNAVGHSDDASATPILLGGDSHTGGTTQTTTTSSSGGSSTMSGGSQSSGLIINVTYDASCASAPSGFTADVAAAVQYFESHFSDPITININVGYGECAGMTLGSGALGTSNYNYNATPYTYSQVKNALVADAKTANDMTSIGTLPSTDPTNGGAFYLSTAEAKALGLASGSSLDGSVGFSNANVFDFNNSDGVNAGQYDFMGTVMHEISEVLGRTTIDGQNYTGAPDFNALDLFHYSAPNVLDFSGTTPGYFSINGGQTNLNNFNTSAGGDFGDWAGSAGYDAATAFGVPGVVMPFTASDLTAMDVIGWNLSSSGPTAPTIASFSPDTGVVGDRITDANMLTLTGSAAASSTVNVYDGATLLGTATANSSGAWSFITATLTDGTHSFTATDTVSGATSSASTALNVTIDTVAPAAPVISSDTILNTNQVMVSGTALDQGVAEAGDVVKVYDGTTLLGTTTTNASGAWSYTTAPLSYGSHVLTATVTDVAGNTSALSQAFDPTILPPAPAVTAFSPDTGIVGDRITDANMLTLTGSAAASSTVNVYDGATLLGTATANSSGAWSFTTATLADGTHSFTATDTVSGATSSASTALNVTIDTVAPTAPVISSDTILSTNQVVMSGTALDQGVAEAGDVIKIYDGSALLGTTTTDATGAWNFTSAALSSGTHSLTATDTDVAGNTGMASTALSVTINTAGPAAPTIASFSPNTGVVGDGITNDNTLTLTGTAAVNSSVNLYDGTLLLGAAMADATGAWSFATATLADGTHSFTATDTVLGATSSASAALNVTVDTVAPAAPVITSDAIVNSNQVMVSGSALDQAVSEAGDVVKIYDGTTLLGTTTTDATGAWNYTSAPLSDGFHVLTATVTDAAGNTSAASQGFDPAIAPPAPVINACSPDTGAIGDGITDANMLTLSGMAEANTTVSIYDGSTLLGTATVNASGAWSFATATLADGIHSFTAADTDSLSLTSAHSSAYNVTVDTIAPTNVFTSDVKNSNGSFTLTGTALDQGVAGSGDVIKVYDGATLLGSTTVGSNGQWSFTTAALSNTVHTFTSTATDVAGNLANSTGSAIYGTKGNDTLVSITGNDIMTGGGGTDTFVFNGSSFGKDIITDFMLNGGHNSHDVIQFSQNVFNSFAAVLAHATQIGSNVVITADANDTVTLNNVQLNKLGSADFHFA